MASSSAFSFLLALAVLVAAASARPGFHFHPCKTLLISYTFTSSDTIDHPQVSVSRDVSAASYGGYFAVYRVFRPIHALSSSARTSLAIHDLYPRRAAVAWMVRSKSSFGMSSLQERAKDILVVVAGLLFGVGCGALTGAIMYLAWSLFTNQYDTCRSSDEDEEDESPRKMGYVKIADPVPTKEGYEEN
ncbi:hypothetical protein HPP92_022519 [Vanilla planifolia]|uniref:Uncharacterized protein n=1 Tax=Vanilla planifolia TaxID=51239 RepID=A0A835PWN9_VANPL|nr:hypothetical protein HPP92_022519 [Vanilla planifolia]